MKGHLCHVFLNISNPKESFPYYKELLTYFNYKIEFENEEYLGMTNGVTDLKILVQITFSPIPIKISKLPIATAVP